MLFKWLGPFTYVLPKVSVYPSVFQAQCSQWWLEGPFVTLIDHRIPEDFQHFENNVRKTVSFSTSPTIFAKMKVFCCTLSLCSFLR